MKILVFGVGFLGNKLINSFSKNHYVIGADIKPTNKKIKKIDATNKNAVIDFIFNERPDVVIDTVALSSYFTCEKNPELCQKLNFETAKNIADGCNAINAKMVFISSSYIFDGKKGDYSELDTPNSHHQYAKSKVRAEKKVLELKDSIIIRPESLYGYDDVKKQITIGTNTFECDAKVGYPELLRCPVLVDDLPKIISLLLKKNQSGIFHVASSKKITWIDFLTKVAAIVNATDKIKIVDTSNWILKPPHDTSLNISKLSSLEIKTTSFNDGILKLKKIIANK